MKKTLDYFKEICSIPHGSYNIDAISDYLADFAKANNLSYRRDELKNVIIRKEATKGFENEEGIILQGHMDMVAVKEEGADINLEKDGLKLREENGFLFAEGTSLGGDDGIAIAMAMEILTDDELPHPYLECIFTVNEEVGMDGANGIDLSDIKGKYLINIDSEEEGVITTSCAGGVRLLSLLECERNIKAHGNIYSIEIKGLKGGHSGTSIHEGRANAIILCGKLLKEILAIGKTDLIAISGGEKDNAIPKFSQMVFSTDAGFEELAETVTAFDEKINEEFKGIEKEIQIVVTPVNNEGNEVYCIDKTEETADILSNVINGVVKMCEDIPMVETSLNLGVMNLDNEGLKLDFCLRSSVSKEKEDLKEKLGTFLAKKGCALALSGDYPGWEYRKDSLLRERFVSSYRKLYKKEPVVCGVHAGLECGILVSKKSDLDCVSVGPNILCIHTTEEKLDLSSVERTVKLIRDVISSKD
ncbi:MAG: beta-Ala-His dipeptidase [Lachnospiraceae bacterium]|nr:beta-Ala-His dipeptidase [Lachnospiraceae bacterium]